MLLTDARNRLLVDLSDVDKDLLTEDVLDRSIQRAVSDLSRFLPRDRIYEITLIFTVPDEKWTSAAAAGTYVALDNKPIKEASETVKNNDGTTCVRDTDYYIDYTNGKITHISGERIGEGEECTISYTKSKIIVDISSIIDDLVRVDRVEYPVGDVPQSFVPYELWEDLLTVKSEAMETQTAMTENEHVAIYYSSKHTAPTPSADGTYPDFLDDTVILAASAYALFSLAAKYVGQSVTDFASARTALGNISAIHGLTNTALDAAATALAAATTALGSGNIDDFLSSASAPSADKYLNDGDEFMNVVTVGGPGVAERYALYAQRSTEIALSFIQAAREHNANAVGYTAEATGRISEIDRHLGEADRYVNLAIQNLGLAEKLRVIGAERRNEAWLTWHDPRQFAALIAKSSSRQATK